ncbi:NAD(P)-binding oxidoreductase [Lentilactobacillus kisonensis]|uniref:NAD(P)-binding domain-containing protein n=1 Tax=Lentilactobacillus kisonensis F0435 TaxID=797516 RepID=H1LL30_9LACO|nr:NAD(P)-binding oxidoreductase [Lentilactobacillus kisonensis]EHO45332.1 hypothetical protein HMPREF9104_03338 [Lentilactobacillus kisonensis F0435]
MQGVDWILTALGPNDVDLDFEALFDGIDDVQPPISHFVMLSYAGVDDELPVQPSYENVKNLTEFIKQQRYAIKIVDESEIPYSIIRVPKLIDRANSKYQLFNEGEAMPNGEVSNEAVARLVLAAFKDNQLINRSVGIINA